MAVLKSESVRRFSETRQFRNWQFDVSMNFYLTFLINAYVSWSSYVKVIASLLIAFPSVFGINICELGCVCVLIAVKLFCLLICVISFFCYYFNIWSWEIFISRFVYWNVFILNIFSSWTPFRNVYWYSFFSSCSFFKTRLQFTERCIN